MQDHTNADAPKRIQKKPVIERGRTVPHVYMSVRANGEPVYLVRKPIDPHTGRRDFVTIGGSLADAKEAAARAHMKDGTQVAVSATTLADVYDDWLRTRTDLAPRTIEHVEGNYRLRIEKPLGRMKVRDINPAVIQRWVNGLKRIDGKPLADGTRANALTVLNLLLRHAVDMGRLAEVPKLPRHRKPKPSPARERVLSPDEETRLLDAAIGWLRPMVQVALWQALRIGEVCGLRWEDVDFDANRLHVRHALGRDGSLGPTKGRKECSIVLLPEARRVLAAAHLAAGRPSDGWVFMTGVGTPRGHKQVSVAYAKAVKSAGLDGDGVCFHTLRHTGLTRAGARAGMTLAYLQQFARHANAQITVRYLHVDSEERMEQVFGVERREWRGAMSADGYTAADVQTL